MRTHTLAVAALPLLLSGCTPLLDAATGAERVEPRDLAGIAAGALVVDLRGEDAYARGHVPGAVRVPFAGLNGFLHAARAGGDRPVVFACEDGHDASLAVPVARVSGFARPAALAGGMSRWRALGLPLATGAGPPLAPAAPPELVLTTFQQGLAVAAGLVVKPTYMLLALVLAAWMRRRPLSRGLRLLWHGLVWFFVGEAFCAVNLAWHLPGRVYLADVAHGAGMVLMSALIPWGLYALADERVLRLSDPDAACRVQALCGRCWKRDPVRCGVHDLMFLVAAAGAIVSLVPLSLPLRPVQLVADLFGARTDVGVPIVNHLVELRLYPVLAVACFLATLPLLRGGPRAVRRAEPVFFAGVGFLAYALLRFLLSGAFRDAPFVSDFWEELTELLMIAATGLVLVLFRRQLGLAPGNAGAGAAAAPAA
jgi:rhodanese-related sulfurtransferase